MSKCNFCSKTYNLVYATISFIDKDSLSTDNIIICLDCGTAVRSFINIYNIEMTIQTNFEFVEETIEEEEEFV